MDNETREMFHLILDKIGSMESKVDVMQNDITESDILPPPMLTLRGGGFSVE